ncbi:MAG: DNA polymerase III subunit gamma/tau, partial [Candidatus Omnitrophica bacterium]|nr:DNA polymerase III subunit gamma/tau [Candidatus Omnitrophota bacterium]
LLKNAIDKGRLAYAYLFSGPRGVGKTSTARILAKSLNCKKGPAIIPCQECSSCNDITQCRSLDVIEIDGASNRGIDEIRALRESVKFPPSSGKFKIYIIDEVHMLTNEAFNALLKTLEEPPKFVKFIFATTQVNKIPATILSRCQRLDFRRIPIVDIIKQLKNISLQEKIDLDEEVLFAIGRASDGSLRDAESILDQLISFSQKGKISISDVTSLLGILQQEILFDITDKIIDKDAAGALRLLNEMLKQGKAGNIILSNIIEHFRNLIVAKISHADPYLIDLPAETTKKLLAQSEHFSLEEVFTIFNILVNTQQMSKKLNSSIIPLEINLIRLTHEKKKKDSLKQEKQQVKAAKQPVGDDIQVESAKAPESGKQEANPGPCLGSDSLQAGLPDEINECWFKLIDDFRSIRMSVATFLSEGTPVKLERNTLTVSFPNNCSLHKDSLEKKENKQLIEKKLSDALGRNIKAKFILSLINPAQQKLDKKHSGDSFIHSALNAFNARFL